MTTIHPLPAASLEQASGAAGTRASAPAPAPAPAQAAPGLDAARPGATVELSPTAASLRSSAAPAEFDAAKVDRIAQSIAQGRFAVNAEAIADKLIANAQELLGKVQR